MGEPWQCPNCRTIYAPQVEKCECDIPMNSPQRTKMPREVKCGTCGFMIDTWKPHSCIGPKTEIINDTNPFPQGDCRNSDPDTLCRQPNCLSCNVKQRTTI